MSNIKFLKGYGISIRQKQNQIQLTNGSDPFTGKKESESFYENQIPYEKIVLSGDGYISTRAIKTLLSNNIHIIQVDTFGNLITSMSTPVQSQVMTKWRMGQYQTFADETRVHQLRVHFMAQKIESEIRLFEYILGNGKKSIRPAHSLDQTVMTLKHHLENIRKAKSLSQITRIEQDTAIIYFKKFSEMIPERFDYSTRYNGVWFNATKENATNVINALLNYGYSVLSSEIAKYVHAFGLDPYYGFNHKTGYFMALVYDIIEPFRTVVDSTVLQMANSNANDYGRIHKKHYYNSKKGFVLLDTRLITMFLERLQSTLNKKRPYKITRGGRTSKRLNHKMSHAQESTIIKENVRKLADYCIEKSIFF